MIIMINYDFMESVAIVLHISSRIIHDHDVENHEYLMENGP